MNWTMPRSVLQLVAGLIALSALTSFGLGIYNASSPARLPGEGVKGQGTAAPLQAMEATPLSQERIEGPPPAPELTEAEKAKQEADKKAKAEAAAKAKLAAAEAESAAPADTAPPAAATPPPAAPPPAQQPSPDEPPF